MKSFLVQKFNSIKTRISRAAGKRKLSSRKTRFFDKDVTRPQETRTILVAGKSRVVITVVCTLIIAGLFFYFISNILFFLKLEIKPYPDANVDISSSWGGGDRLNIAVLGLDRKTTGHTFVDRVVVLHINPESKKLGIFATNTKFISNLNLNTSDSIKNSYILAEEGGKGLQYTINALEDLLGIKIDRYIVIDNQGVNNIFINTPLPEVEIPEDIVDPDFKVIEKGDRKLSAEELYNYLASDVDGEDQSLERLVKLVRDMVKDLSKITTLITIQSRTEVLLSNLNTNLDKKELVHLFLFLRELRSDQIKIAYTRDDVLNIIGDNAEKWSPIYENIDRDLSTIFDNPSVRLEQAKIEILNATNIPGLASTRSRLLENAGCRVVRVGNTSDFYDTNYIYVKDPEKYKETIKEINAVFSHDIEIIEDEYPYRHIGDLVIIIANFEDE